MNIKETIIIVTLLLILGILLLKVTQIKEERDNAKNIVQSSLDTTQFYKNKWGEEIAQKRVLEVTNKGLKENIAALGINEEKLKDQIGSLKNLNNRLKANIQSQQVIYVYDSIEEEDVVVSDSVFEIQGDFDWKGDHLTVNGTYKMKGRYHYDGMLTLSSINFNQQIDYDYQLDIISTTYRRRDPKWKLWKEKELVTDITITDPNAKITNIESLHIVENPKKFYEKTWFWMIVTFGVTTVVIR